MKCKLCKKCCICSDTHDIYLGADLTDKDFLWIMSEVEKYPSPCRMLVVDDGQLVCLMEKLLKTKPQACKDHLCEHGIKYHVS
jgi:hypothetical protein